MIFNLYRIGTGLLLCVFGLLISCGSLNAGGGVPSFGWIESNEAVDLSWTDNVGTKSVPHGEVFRVEEFGAVADTTVVSTAAIQAAIDHCYGKGGGTVVFDSGHYKTGALFIKSNVNLCIGEGVVLFASTDLADYPEIRSRIAGIEMDWPSAVLNVLDADNSAITGSGVIDCRGNAFWESYWEMRKEYEKEGLRWIVDYDCKRVRGVLVSNSSNVSLTDFTLLRTGFWGVQIVYSEYCTVAGLTINNNIGGYGPSTDGIDIDSSSHILVEGCDIDCNDDNICLKAGRDADGLRVNRPTEYIVIRNCTARRGAGLITCGSETSGGIRNILAYNLEAYGNDSAVRIKSALNRGGVVENIYVSNVIADSVNYVLSADLNWHPSYSYSVLPHKYRDTVLPEHWKVMLTPVEPAERGHPAFRNIFISGVRAKRVGQFISVSGWNDTLRPENFQFHDIEAEAQTAGRVKLTSGFIFSEIDLRTADGSEIVFDDNT